ncbi:hypothetical protein KBY28_20995 [Ruegeria pomeroyi]|uniref:hypothetical protein n=1 Tax=Ruegeria pomeroyi TaxID=89184 RepID=UPI001F2E806D|nr:hypothetical protein [Ruegeria pomeroyi]MCE8510935.1 hypothetical protein [Ruegeria pomeroyi]
MANFGPIVHEHLNLPEDELVVCGIAVGVPNKGAKVNHFRTERSSLAEFTTFRGFEDI